MSGNAKRYFYLIVVFILAGCVEPIEFDIDREGRQLVVYGHIDDGSDRMFVQLSRTTAVPNRFQPEPGARVTLHDNLGNEGRFFSANDEGIYYYSEFTMQIVPGRSYVLRIRTAGGDFYESVPEEIPLHQAQSDIYVNFARIEVNTGSFNAVITKDVMQVSAETFLEDPSKQYYVRYTPIQTFRFDPTNFPDIFNTIPPACFVNRRIQPENLVLFNSNGFQGTAVPRQFIAQNEIDYAFIAKNVITLETHSMTPQAYDYWRKIRILLNNNGSIFDTPPAAVKGNIFNINDPDEQVLGYFEATNKSISRVTAWRGDFPYPVPDDPCIYIPGQDEEKYLRECIDCRILEGSTFNQPSFY
ncbi:DUF4249 domain-containing protein [Fulvivirga sedimenti]|uniref:DUF4249 domain-containing protein n=1 Tax=Fulvivirga sedimenti TaxID=2879465 RepID=A0A9X1HRV4_9BACT|nr:DUF4249 domain-containing protein [Fulvivirga sedimenti]MCA6075239.1 DUF4249 domain-containing protein [Fulvivirga sedimenti]MCA6076416.1 DUF4249 domain-containing protein [Fulvivirga sedimenti]MCA6077544.1 DUF4249 domain-containing protein [Fulvivirga sedimenti]